MAGCLSGHGGVAHGDWLVRENRASSVVGVTAGNYWESTFAHELGHNMGLHHERYQALLDYDGFPLEDFPFPTAFGFAGPIDDDARTPCLKTIMAYGTECRDTTLRSFLFSNPNRKVAGQAVGVPGTKPSSRVDGPANAVRHVNRMRRRVANFRRTPCLSDGMLVRLQASNGQYVIAVGNGGGAVRADQLRRGRRGLFTLVDHNG